MGLPALLELVADEDRDGVHEQQDDQQQHDRRRGEFLEFGLRFLDQVVDLDGQGGVGAEQAVGVEPDEGDRAEQDQRGCLTDRAGHGEDRTGGHAGYRSGEHLAGDGLPFGGTQGVGGLPDRLGYRPDGFPAGDDDGGQDQQGQHDRGGDDGEAQPEDPGDQAQAEDAENDRRHPGEDLDVQFQKPVVPAGVVGVLLQVDRGEDAGGQAHQRGQPDDPQGAGDR